MPSVTNIKPRPSAPPMNGLIATLGAITNASRWLVPTTTLDYLPEGCVEGEIFDLCDTPTVIEAAEAPNPASWKPYGLAIAVKCSSLSGEEDNNRGKALRAIENVTESLIAREFWSGDLAQTGILIDGMTPWPNNWLANWASPELDNLSAGGPVTIGQGISCLDQYLSSLNGGQQGAIHLTAQALTLASAAQAVYREGGKWYTPNGNLVIASPGYPGTGSSSNNVGSHNVWAYATDIPRVYLGEILAPRELKHTADRTTNTVFYLAQRGALVEWERCRHGAVQLDITVCDTGGS